MTTSGEDSYFSDIETRLRRGETWLDCARREHEAGGPCSGHWDVAFLLYWIAFNAAFATEDSESPNTHREFHKCFAQALRLDHNGEIPRALETFAGPMHKILNNKYLFNRYWYFVNGRPGNEDWRARFDNQLAGVTNARRRPQRARAKTILSLLFQRLATLRNQIVHGGATWKSRYNRSSVENGLPIMAHLVPVFIRIIREHRKEDWGTPYYRPGLQGKFHPECSHRQQPKSENS